MCASATHRPLDPSTNDPFVIVAPMTRPIWFDIEYFTDPSDIEIPPLA